MATGRTAPRWARIWVHSTNYSGYVTQLSPLLWEYEAETAAALSDPVKGGLPGIATHGVGTINSVFNMGATSPTMSSLAGTQRPLTIALGIRAEPAAGDPVYTTYAAIDSYQATPTGGGMTMATLETSAMSSTGLPMYYSKPWGVLLHAQAAETAVNTAVGIDDNGASSALGGYMVYHITAVGGTGTGTIKVQHASTNSNGSFGDLTGATASFTGIGSGIVQCATNETVNRYLRWQLVLDTFTSVTFILAFVRSLSPGV